MVFLSLFLGLASWALALRACLGRRGSLPLLLTGSGAACGASLLLQLVYVTQEVSAQDWSALLDTMDAVVRAGTALLAVTIFLNLLAIWLNRPANLDREGSAS